MILDHTSTEREKVLKMLHKILYVKDNEIFFIDQDITTKACSLNNLVDGVYQITPNEGSSNSLLTFIVDKHNDRYQIQEGVLNIDQDTSEIICDQTLFYIFDLNMNVRYLDKEKGSLMAFDIVAFMRAYIINNIIHD